MIRFSLVASFFVLQITFAIVLGADPKLVLVNVVHRHGDRTPSNTETYPNDPYINHTYWPIGRGGLTNVLGVVIIWKFHKFLTDGGALQHGMVCCMGTALNELKSSSLFQSGKSRLHNLGKALRSMYGDFLGRTYTPEILVTRSSEFDRTKMSAQLVLSGLYPPDPIQQWNENLLWQPIPTVYSPLLDDIWLLPFFCSTNYITEFEKILATAEMQKKIAQFNGLMATIGKHTGQKITNTMELYNLYMTYSAQLAANLTLQDWVKEFYPNGELLNATLFHYELISYNDNLKRSFGGTLLRKITDDVASYAKGTLDKGRKLFQYSAHDVNIAGLQSTLGVYEPHVPTFVSAMIIEIWQHDDDLFVKVLYFTGNPAELRTQKIPGCEELCPFDKFLELLKPVIAKDSDYECTCRNRAELCKSYWKYSGIVSPSVKKTL